MTTTSCLYLLTFLPLIGAAICQILPIKKIAFGLTLFFSLAILALILKIFPQILAHKNIANDFNLSLLSIALEFKIDLVGYCFLILVVFLKIVILFFYHSDIEKFLNEKNARIFYSVFLINLFGLVNIFATNNLFNLFVFLEIYAFSFFAISALAKDSELLKISFRDFCLNAASSLLILFCFLMTLLIFKKSNFDQVITFEGMNLLMPSVMLIFLTTAFLIKFFPFWLFFDKMKNGNLISNFLIAESMFIKGAIGFFLILKFVYFYFGQTFLFSTLNLDYPLIAVAIILITFGAIGVYQEKHLQTICAYLCLSNVGFFIAAIALSSQESLRSAFFYVLNFSLVNLFIFIFATFLKRHFETSSIAKIWMIRRDHLFLALPLKIIIFFVAAFPLTPLFFANWHLASASLIPGFEAVLLLGLVVANFAFIDLALRFIEAIFSNQKPDHESGTVTFPLKKYQFYFASFWVLLIVIFAAVFFAAFVNNLSDQFASYLLSL